MLKWLEHQYDGSRVAAHDFQAFIEENVPLAKPSWIKGFVFHNTGAPTLAQVVKTPDRNKDQNPIDDRMRNVRDGYNAKGWKDAKGTRGPHWFAGYDDCIYLGTYITRKGIHSPGFNDGYIAGEMFGDFRVGSDDDDAGLGLKVKDVMCRWVGCLFAYWGMKANNDTIKLHKEDSRTTHDCPGNDVLKADLITRVQKYIDEYSLGGDLTPASEAEPVVPREHKVVVADVTPGDVLNMRDLPSASGTLRGRVPRGTKLTVLAEASNADTLWLQVRTPAGYEGWVSAKYTATPAVIPAGEPIIVKPVEVPAPPPPPEGGTVVPPVEEVKPADMAEPGRAVVSDHNDVAMALLTGLPFYWRGEHFPADYLKKYGLRPYAVHQAAGLTGNLMRESFARMVTSALGDVGTAYGIAQWRDDRQRELRKFAAKWGRPVDDVIIQLVYAVHELQVDDETDEVYAGKLLDASKNVEEATAAGVAFERPRGWKRPLVGGKTTYDLSVILPAAKKGDGYQIRLDNARQMVKEYETAIRPR